jgi:hypothetical protein
MSSASARVAGVESAVRVAEHQRPQSPVAGHERHRDDGGQLETEVELQRLGAAVRRLRCRKGAAASLQADFHRRARGKRVVHGGADDFVVQARDRFAARRSVSEADPGDLRVRDRHVLLQHGQRSDVRQIGHDEPGHGAHVGCDIQRTGENIACLREKGETPGRFLGGGARRLLARERDALVRLALDLARHQEEIDEDLDLAAQHRGHDRRQHVVHRAERIRLGGVHLLHVRRQEDDRRVAGCAGVRG